VPLTGSGHLQDALEPRVTKGEKVRNLLILGGDKRIGSMDSDGHAGDGDTDARAVNHRRGIVAVPARIAVNYWRRNIIAATPAGMTVVMVIAMIAVVVMVVPAGIGGAGRDGERQQGHA